MTSIWRMYPTNRHGKGNQAVYGDGTRTERVQQKVDSTHEVLIS